MKTIQDQPNLNQKKVLLRLDLNVPLKNGKITVFGGEQTRPNIHIKDIINVYRHFLYKPEIKSGCYNAGFENISILEIAEMIVTKVPAEIVITESNDPRSYRQNSDKLLGTNYIKRFSVQDGIDVISNGTKAFPYFS